MLAVNALYLIIGLLVATSFPFPAQCRAVQQGTQATAPSDPQSQQPSLGKITGAVLDAAGAIISGARVKLTCGNPPQSVEVISDDNGQFSFSEVVPGPFQINVSSEAFATQTYSGVLHRGEVLALPSIKLSIASENMEIHVAPSQFEIAQEQLKDEEKQRVLGVIPNFYVTYDPYAVSLTSKQKFSLAWKTSIDPVTILFAAAVAGVQQGENDYSGYGQGAQGYAKRFGASYADGLTGTFLSSAVLPAIFKQDPRYFYKGTGGVRTRFLYAIANALVCKGDNKRWQPNYSGFLGSVASGGISNLYYPENNRGARLVMEGALYGIAGSAVANLFQEFVARKFTPHVPNYGSAGP